MVKKRTHISMRRYEERMKKTGIYLFARQFEQIKKLVEEDYAFSFTEFVRDAIDIRIQMLLKEDGTIKANIRSEQNEKTAETG